MGLFDEVMGAVTGAAGQGEQAGQGNLLNNVIGMLGQNGSGGLAGVIEQFKNGGLGHIVDSWVGTGSNLPVSAEQLQQVLGSDRLAQMAQQAGLSTDNLTQQLTQILPQVVDKLTPNGTVPEGNILEQGLNLLRTRL